MGRIVFLLAVGIFVGYLSGWRDAQNNAEPVYSRTLAKIGGATRGRVQSNVDTQMNALERR